MKRMLMLVITLSIFMLMSVTASASGWHKDPNNDQQNNNNKELMLNKSRDHDDRDGKNRQQEDHNKKLVFNKDRDHDDRDGKNRQQEDHNKKLAFNKDRDHDDRDGKDRRHQDDRNKQRRYFHRYHDDNNWRHIRHADYEFERGLPFGWYDHYDSIIDRHYLKRIYDWEWEHRFPGTHAYRWCGEGGFWYHGRYINDAVLFFDDDNRLISIGYMFDDVFIHIREDHDVYENHDSFFLRWWGH